MFSFSIKPLRNRLKREISLKTESSREISIYRWRFSKAFDEQKRCLVQADLFYEANRCRANFDRWTSWIFSFRFLPQSRRKVPKVFLRICFVFFLFDVFSKRNGIRWNELVTFSSRTISIWISRRFSRWEKKRIFNELCENWRRLILSQSVFHRFGFLNVAVEVRSGLKKIRRTHRFDFLFWTKEKRKCSTSKLQRWTKTFFLFHLKQFVLVDVLKLSGWNIGEQFSVREKRKVFSAFLRFGFGTVSLNPVSKNFFLSLNERSDSVIDKSDWKKNVKLLVPSRKFVKKTNFVEFVTVLRWFFLIFGIIRKSKIRFSRNGRRLRRNHLFRCVGVNRTDHSRRNRISVVRTVRRSVDAQRNRWPNRRVSINTRNFGLDFIVLETVTNQQMNRSVARAEPFLSVVQTSAEQTLIVHLNGKVEKRFFNEELRFASLDFRKTFRQEETTQKEKRNQQKKVKR